MSLRSLRPLLRTWDLSRSIAFYEGTLGFRCDARSDEHAWASLSKDGVSIMLSGPSACEGDVAPAFTGSLYFDCDDVDAMWASVKDRAKVCYPIENFHYGMREFGIYDDSGYLLCFGMPTTVQSSDDR